MSLGQRLHTHKDKGAEKGAEMEPDKRMRALKQLSKSQTALLKSYLHGKLAETEMLVSKAVELLGSSSSKEAKALSKSLQGLRLSELEIDVTSAKMEMQEELSQLRLLSEGTSFSSSSIPPAPGQAQGVPEVEVRKLKEKLASAERQIEGHKSSGGAGGAGGGAVEAALLAQLGDKDAKCAALEGELAGLRRQVAQLSKATEDDTSAKLSDQLAQAASNLALSATKAAQSQKDLESSGAKWGAEAKEWEGKLAAATALTASMTVEVAAAVAQGAANVIAAEERLEAEKEEMMEAMAQEIEEIESTKAQEFAELTQTIETLTKTVETGEARITALTASTTILTANLTTLSSAARTLRSENAASRAKTQSEMGEMGVCMAGTKTALLGRLGGMQEQLDTALTRYRKEMQERKKLHNIIQELKGNIRVFMRCRPPTKKELEQFGNDAQCVLFPNPGEVKVFNEKNREKMWEFDEVFDTTTNQIQVYNEVSALVTSVMDGFNVCIFAYGQTGSGKTWTMSGPPEDRGVNTRALEELFLKSTQRASEWKDVITVSLLEVYNEEIHDLLSDGGDKLEVKLGPHGNHVPGLVCQNVTNIASVLTLITQADRNRSSTATNMNEHSSRSHMILTVTVLSEYLPTGVQTRGKLNLVDLAGSERINKSGAIGQALTEAKSINKSLSALGDVIAARAAKQAHVPFRNSTLTFLLQDSLSQDSKTLMLVCVSPVLYNSEETFCSLNFASRVRTIELGKVTKTTVGAPAPKKK